MLTIHPSEKYWEGDLETFSKSALDYWFSPRLGDSVAHSSELTRSSRLSRASRFSHASEPKSRGESGESLLIREIKHHV